MSNLTSMLKTSRKAHLALPLANLFEREAADGLRAIESDEFPFEAISNIAERESWRKEINRPAEITNPFRA
jgi:hypothetical protein